MIPGPTSKLEIDSVLTSNGNIFVSALLDKREIDFKMPEKDFDAYVKGEGGLSWALGDESGEYTIEQFYRHPARFSDYLEQYLYKVYIK